jgi:hypothetical protein
MSPKHAFCAVAASSLLAGAASVAETAQPRAGAKPTSRPDWSGMWENTTGFLFTNPIVNGKRTPNPPPLTPEYAAKYQVSLDAAKAGRPVNDPTANCVWPGVPRVIVSPYPSEYIVEPHRVTIIYEYMSQVRRIRTDGSGHPPDLDPSFNGDSIGHWEGDTLVVDTVGLRADTMFEQTGLPHSDALQVKERIRLAGPDELVDEMTFIDPKALARPWTVTARYRRHRDWKMMDYVCEENNRNPNVGGVTLAR